MDWHEEDDPRAVQPVKKGEPPQPPTRVLEIEAAGAHTMVKRLVHDWEVRCSYNSMASVSWGMFLFVWYCIGL